MIRRSHKNSEAIIAILKYFLKDGVDFSSPRKFKYGMATDEIAELLVAVGKRYEEEDNIDGAAARCFAKAEELSGD